MKRVATGAARDVHQFIYAEIAFARRRGADRIGLIGEANVKRIAVNFAENGYGFDAEFAAGADDAYGDFAAIGDEDFAEHEPSVKRRKLSTRTDWVEGGFWRACLMDWVT